MAKIYAPFTDDQVKKLQAWQEGNTQYLEKAPGQFINLPHHPFTCCSVDGCDRGQMEEGILIPTRTGWICPCGKYAQDWCHDFMVGEAIATLMEKTMAMIELAKSKGFETSVQQYISPTFFEPDQDPEQAFCNTACAIVAWWLRKYKNAFIWVEAMWSDPGLYIGMVQHIEVAERQVYEEAWLEAITFALEQLPTITVQPPGAQGDDGNDSPVRP